MDQQDRAARPAPGAIRVGRKEFSLGGFGYGLRQEFLKAEVFLEVPADVDWAAIDGALAAVIPASDADEPPPVTGVDRIIRWTGELQRAGGQLVLERGKLIGAMARGGNHVLALPTSNAEAASDALSVVTTLVGRLIDGVPSRTQVVTRARSAVNGFIKKYSAIRVGSSNTPHLIRAAFENRMPCFILAGDVLQVGMGSNARWLESTLTDATPAISMRLARSKLAAAAVLRQGGLPVPAHQLAHSADEAVAIAARLGYPVVVKPADRDGGLAVAAGLTGEAGVREAFEAAHAASKYVMVEKHVDGRDYRLVVHDGRMIWALERVPGGVTGDGASTVAELIERLNAEPARAKRADAPLKPLLFDKEAAELLAGYGMTPETVPAEGQRIRLRRAANVATGGTPEAAFDRVHPDNARLAERAAALLRLDLAGIDLLIPDIARSWRETGAAICEVNAQPTIGNTTSKHLYGQILKSLVKGEGRIPIVLVAGAGPRSTVPALVARILGVAGLRTAIATAQQCVVGDTVLHGSPRNLFDSARAALVDRQTNALVVAASDGSILSTGLPFDRCSTIVLAGARFAGTASEAEGIGAFARLLVPTSLGGIVLASGAAQWRPIISQARNARVVLSSAGGESPVVRDHAAAGGETVIIEPAGAGWRLSMGGDSIDIVAGGTGKVACAPEELALAAAAARSVGCALDVIRRGLSGLRIAQAGAAA